MAKHSPAACCATPHTSMWAAEDKCAACLGAGREGDDAGHLGTQHHVVPRLGRWRLKGQPKIGALGDWHVLQGWHAVLLTGAQGIHVSRLSTHHPEIERRHCHLGHGVAQLLHACITHVQASGAAGAWTARASRPLQECACGELLWRRLALQHVLHLCGGCPCTSRGTRSRSGRPAPGSGRCRTLHCSTISALSAAAAAATAGQQAGDLTSACRARRRCPPPASGLAASCWSPAAWHRVLLAYLLAASADGRCTAGPHRVAGLGDGSPVRRPAQQLQGLEGRRPSRRC